MFSGAIEQDFIFKFFDGPLYGEDVLKAINARLGLPPRYQQLFGLWIISKDLELQINPKMDIVPLVRKWHEWMTKYTHIPEAQSAVHPINKYIFMYRREALVNITEEIAIDDELVIRLLYGEARYSVLNRRYPCQIKDIRYLGGLELQTISNYNTVKYPEYLASDNKWTGLVPVDLQKSLSPDAWVNAFKDEHRLHQGLTPLEAKKKYIAYVRKFPYYGWSTFPCCKEIPPGMFFELRLEYYYLGINYENIVIMDKREYKIVYSEKLDKISWSYKKDVLRLHVVEEGHKKTYVLVTPQVSVIVNLLKRAVHLHRKAHSLGEQKPPARHQRQMSVLSIKDTSLSKKDFKTPHLDMFSRKNSSIVARRLSDAHHVYMKAVYGDGKVSLISEGVAKD